MSKRPTPGSGLRGIELIKAISTLEELEKLSQEEEMDEAVGEGVEASQRLAAKVVSDKIADLITTLKAKAEGPLSFSFSSIDFEILDEQLNISPGGPLINRGDHADRVAGSIALGGDTYMSSEDMYRHLNLLENLVPTTNEAGARLWIDTIFFRVSAMLSGSKRMVLNLKEHIPSVGISVPGQTCPLKITGAVDYAALTMDIPKHHSFIRNSLFQFVKRQDPNGLFVTEAKQEGVSLAQHVAHAVAEMYASAKYLAKSILRGALTNGHDRIFLILYLNEDGTGRTYTESPVIKMRVSDNYPYSVLSPGPDIIAGILAYWVLFTLFSSVCPYERMLDGTEFCWS
ncbi:hypothetical protein HD554DRAFT_2310459 [Boletus coccyginus]|nr:hypothetical protein HD554DRAFT_2310459 [Boletus coccyginus]